MAEVARGAIYNEARYQLAKMFDHSCWLKGNRILPRSITPSDVDAVLGHQLSFIPIVFDNNKRMIICELSRSINEWRWLNAGQKWMYESLIYQHPHAAVLCKHDVDP